MRYVAVICMLVAFIPEATAGEMTHEETMVRTAYAKFSYAVQLGAITALAQESEGFRPPTPEYGGMTSDQRLAAAQVGFTLSDFVVGDTRDIVNRKIGDFVTPLNDPNGEVLGAVGGSMSRAETGGVGTRWDWIEISWHQQPPGPVPPEALKMTVADAYRLQWQEERPGPLWQRYASYTVTVNFQGKSQGPYKALFLFGHDPQGNEVVEPVDTITGATGLVYALHDHLFPEAFLRTHLRTYPVVANWLNANQMPDAACPVGQHDVCCDLVKLKCGPGRKDVADALSKSLPQAPKP